MRRIEHRGVQAHRRRLIEDPPIGLADVHEDCVRRLVHEQLHGLGGIARHPEHAWDVHDAAQRNDAQRYVAAKELARDQANRAVTARRHDQPLARDDQAPDLGLRLLG